MWVYYCALIGKGCAAPSAWVYVPPAYGGFVWLGFSWDLFHILLICFLGMSPFPALWKWLPALSQKDGAGREVCWDAKATAGAKQGVVPGGKNCRHPEEASPSSPSPYKCAVRHIFLLKCWAWKLRQVQGRMRSMGKLGAVGTWKGTLQHKKKNKAGFLFWGIVAFLCLLRSEIVLRCTLLIVLATFLWNCTGIRMRNGKELQPRTGALKGTQTRKEWLIFTRVGNFWSYTHMGGKVTPHCLWKVIISSNRSTHVIGIKPNQTNMLIGRNSLFSFGNGA